MRKSLATLVGILLALTVVFGPSAQANTGYWTMNEFNSLCTVKLDQQYGQLCPGSGSTSGATQTQTENICSCTGTKQSDFTNNGHDFKILSYDGSNNANVTIEYRKWDSSAPWRAFDKVWTA